MAPGPFDDAPVQRVRVTMTLTLDAYVRTDVDAASRSSLHERMAWEAADAVEVHGGWGINAEPGDALVAVLDASAVVRDVETTDADPDRGDVERWAESTSAAKG